MDWKSRGLIFVLFALILGSIGLTYYHNVIKADYVVYTNEEEVPDPADFVAYLVENILGIAPAEEQEADKVEE